VEGQTAERPDWPEHQRRALYAGAAGVVLLAVIALFTLIENRDLSATVQLVLHAYLVAYVFWLGIALGSLALLMVQHLTGGAWGMVIRRVLEGSTRTLPLMAVLFLPLVAGVRELYGWARPTVVASDALLQHKQAYLNVSFFLIRAAAYFAIWLGAAFLLNRWSSRQDETSDAGLSDKFRRLSAPGLVLYGLTVTFASIDWAMSLEPHWFSTIYGVLFGIGQMLSAFALAIAVIAAIATKDPFAGVIAPSHFRDLGGLLLAFVVLWAYVSLSQYLLIWSGNLPEETPWYLRRLEGGWEMVGGFLMLFHFALPFLLLLSRALKEDPRTLRIIAVGIVVARVVDMCWMILPAFAHAEPGEFATIAWLDLISSGVAVVGLGGVWLWLFMHELQRRPLLPFRDPAFAEVTQHD
jgi:hypothetical protein